MENNVLELKKTLESTANVLAAIADAFEKGTGGVPIQEVNKALEDANKTLELPLRNCDVGTAEEQIKRWSDFVAHLNHLPEVPYVHSLSWAQMPYEEGGER